MTKKPLLLAALTASLAAHSMAGQKVQTRQGEDLPKGKVESWLDKYYEEFTASVEGLKDGATFQEALEFVGLVVRAAQDLSDVLRGADRAKVVVAVVCWLADEFIPPDMYWLRMLVNPEFVQGLVEMVFRNLFKPMA